MKNPNKWNANIRAVARTFTVIAIVVIFIGICITPVFARDGRDYRGHGRYQRRGHVYYQPYGYYPAPVYVPPPVVYYPPPPPPPGISFVFPIRIR
jgi:hypothetical protein